MTRTIKISVGRSTMQVRCDLRHSASAVEADYGDGWVPTQYQCADARHCTAGLVEIGRALMRTALEDAAVEPDVEILDDAADLAVAWDDDEVDADQLDQMICEEFGDDPAAHEIEADRDLMARLRGGPTNWIISVSDQAGGEDEYDFTGTLEAAVELGERKARRHACDDNDGLEMLIEVSPAAAPSVVMSESFVTL